MTGDSEPYRPKIVGKCRNEACRDTRLLGRGPYLISQTAWNALSAAEREGLRGFIARKAARDLCTACWFRERRAGTHIDYERRSRPAEERAADYAAIRDELPDASPYERARAAGKRQATPHPLRPNDPDAVKPAHPDTIIRAVRLQGGAL